MEQVTDRWGNRITLTDERWRHIVEWHPELEEFEEEVLETIRKGRRRQDPIDPHKYKYLHPVEELPFGLTHIVVVVRIAARKFVLTPIRIFQRYALHLCHRKQYRWSVVHGIDKRSKGALAESRRRASQFNAPSTAVKAHLL